MRRREIVIARGKTPVVKLVRIDSEMPTANSGPWRDVLEWLTRFSSPYRKKN